MMFAHCLLGVILHAKGKALVTTLNDLDDIHTVGGRYPSDFQRGTRYVTHYLVMP